MGEVCGGGAKKVRAGGVGEIAGGYFFCSVFVRVFVRCLFGCGKVGGNVEKVGNNY